MRRLRLLTLFASAVAILLAFAPEALAVTHAGEGLYGETNDVDITNAMFILIVFFPAIIVVFSLLQAWLDHRKHARMDAQKRRESSIDWKGGW